jgi:hypothetical protein
MAKPLKDILKQAHDRIKGVHAAQTSAGSLGKDPGVDYQPKSGDEDEFVAKHSVERWDEPEGNPDHSKNVKYSLDTPQNSRMGNNHEKSKKDYFVPVKESEDVKCNHTPKGKMCPVHGMLKCWSAKPIKEVSKVNEVLTKSTTAGETIHDFVHSKNPKFAGKSKEKRKQMALAAYYAKQNEEVKEDLAMPLLGSVHGSSDIAKYKTDDTGAEIDMVRTELKAIANKTMHMLSNMPADKHIEPWVQAKIAAAKEMIGAVHDYMVYSDHEENETTDTPMQMPSNPSYSAPDFSADVNSGVNV